MLPRRGRRSTRFSAYFTLRRQPGHVGVLATDYRVAVARPPHSRARCEARVAPDVNGGRVGEVMRVALAAPIGGWCVGRYTVTILLERGPFCPPSTHPTPCPEFATQDLDTGRADFTVQAK